MDKYISEYKKYKTKYLEQKDIMSGSAKIIGSYSEPGKEDRRLVMVTDDNVYVSYVIKSIDKYKDSDFTTDTKKPQPNKIFIINNIDTFDNFTKKYGKISFNRKHIFIQWYRVANDYKGFYLDKSNVDLVLRRKSNVIFGPLERKYKSWYLFEYNNISGVMVFKK